MGPVVGAVLTGTVTSIMSFGAFVDLGDGKSGLVHISEVAESYVDDVSHHLSVGDEVKVKVIGIDGRGRISLSIKQANQPEKPKPPARTGVTPRMRAEDRVVKPYIEPTFEDKLKRFMKDSDSKITCLYSDRRTSRKRGKN